jgi:hypothetical protein
MRCTSFILLLLTATACYAGDSTKTPGSCTVSLHLIALDKSMQPMAVLTSAAITSKVDGKNTSLQFARRSSPANVVIVLDASGSMGFTSVPGVPNHETRKNWDFAIRAGHRIVADLPAGSRAGLVAFNDKPVKQVPLTTQLQTIDDALAAISSQEMKGGTRLWDTLENAANMFDGPGENNLVFVVTDRDDSRSKDGWRRVRDTFLAQGIRLFPIAFPSFSIATPEHNGTADMLDLTLATGGTTIGLRPSLFETFGDPAIVQQLGAVDLLVHTVTNDFVTQLPSVEQGHRPKIKIKLSHASGTLLYPEEVPLCGPGATAMAK